MKAVSASAFVDRLKDNAKAAKAGAGAREVMKNPDSVRSPTQSAVASDDDAVLPDLLSSLSDSLSQARLVGRPKAVRPSGERRRARSEIFEKTGVRGSQGSARVLKRPPIHCFSDSSMGRGASIQFLSAFPNESEVLFPPLTYLKSTGKQAGAAGWSPARL